MADNEKNRRENNVTESERKPIKRKLKRIVRGIFFLICTVALVAFVIYSPLFKLQQITVKGNNYLSQEEIENIARINLGQKLFDVHTDEIKSNLVQDLRIKSATVKRQLPNKIEIEVDERTPVATVETTVGYADIDDSGMIIACYRTFKNMPYPLITGHKLDSVYVGDEVQEHRLKAVLVFLKQIESSFLPKIAEINIINPQSVVAYTVFTRIPIILGSVDYLE